MTVIDTTPKPLTMVERMQARINQDTEDALCDYFASFMPIEYDEDDLDNLVEQGKDALKAVLEAYKVVKQGKE